MKLLKEKKEKKKEFKRSNRKRERERERERNIKGKTEILNSLAIRIEAYLTEAPLKEGSS